MHPFTAYILRSLSLLSTIPTLLIVSVTQSLDALFCEHDQLLLAFVFVRSPEQTRVLCSLSLLSTTPTLLIVSVPLLLPYLAKTK